MTDHRTPSAEPTSIEPAALLAAIIDLQDRLSALAEVVAVQQDELDGWRAASSGANASLTAPTEPIGPADPGESIELAVAADDVTDRRSVLRRAAVSIAAAGAGFALFDAQTAAAASGSFDGNTAVTAANSTNGSSGIGVLGTSTAGTGVRGDGATFGVRGRASIGSGLFGDGFPGLTASSNQGTAMVVSGFTPLGTQPTAEIRSVAAMTGLRVTSPTDQLLFGRPTGKPLAPPTTSLTYAAGAMVFDTSGDLWLCIADGAPGTWRRVSGVNTAGAFTTLSAPVRIYDSRSDALPAVGVKIKLASGEERVLDAGANSSGVPAGAAAILVNLTVVNTAGAGFVALYRNGIVNPGTASINWSGSGQILANTTITAVDAAGLFIALGGGGNSTDIVVDVFGYWR